MTSSDIWYYATPDGEFGPFNLEAMRGRLEALPDVRNVFVWRQGFPDWKRAGSVPEFMADIIVPPRLDIVPPRKDAVAAFARTHYRTLEVVNRLGSAFVFFIVPFFVVRNILVCSWCDQTIILREIPAFNAMLTQDPSMICGFCLVELFCILYITFRVIFCAVFHRQIVDALVNRCKARGHTPVSAVVKMTVIIVFIFIGGLAAMIFSTPNSLHSYSIRTSGLERLEMVFIMFIFLYCYVITELCVYIIYIYQGKLKQ
jgi:hypothetical protein